MRLVMDFLFQALVDLAYDILSHPRSRRLPLNAVLGGQINKIIMEIGWTPAIRSCILVEPALRFSSSRYPVWVQGVVLCDEGVFETLGNHLNFSINIKILVVAILLVTSVFHSIKPE